MWHNNDMQHTAHKSSCIWHIKRDRFMLQYNHCYLLAMFRGIITNVTLTLSGNDHFFTRYIIFEYPWLTDEHWWSRQGMNRQCDIGHDIKAYHVKMICTYNINILKLMKVEGWWCITFSLQKWFVIISLFMHLFFTQLFYWVNFLSPRHTLKQHEQGLVSCFMSHWLIINFVHWSFFSLNEHYIFFHNLHYCFFMYCYPYFVVTTHALVLLGRGDQCEWHDIQPCKKCNTISAPF